MTSTGRLEVEQFLDLLIQTTCYYESEKFKGDVLPGAEEAEF